MRIVFFGTPEFAVHILEGITQSDHELVGVVTAPDRKRGRGQKLAPSPVKEFATKKSIKVLQPTNLKDQSFQNELRDLKGEIFIVVAFRMLPESVWNMPPKGTYNAHASLLPQYRGAAPINWVLINDEKHTGVTVFRLKHEIDTGDILLKESIEIESEDNAGSLHNKLMELSRKLILKALDIIPKNPEFLPQKAFQTTVPLKKAPKLHKADLIINWENSSKSVHNFIRGLSPYPGATTVFQFGSQFKTVKIYKSELTDKPSSHPGMIETDGAIYLRICCKDFQLNITELKIQGRKTMTTPEFLRGTSMEKVLVNLP
ncbi:MAG TPA: methionyl-tRNA formyltransferase [Flavobacteriales bacterium]|jgi:methionyl-tRNA formyltransferase|nr:methionyl-tRNA formyltransferase [Flavobacteriales bacterium]